jgi:hypothetical protein
MHARRIISFVIAVACFLSRAIAADKVATFAALPKGDELEVTFSTSGCFHYFSYELKFHRSAELEVSVVELVPQWSRDLKRIISTNRVSLGDLTLTQTDVDGLDHLLAFYRSRRRGTCTTVDKIAICQRHEGRMAAREHFTDGSCSNDRKDVTRITELVARLEKSK